MQATFILQMMPKRHTFHRDDSYVGDDKSDQFYWPTCKKMHIVMTSSFDVVDFLLLSSSLILLVVSQARLVKTKDAKKWSYNWRSLLSFVGKRSRPCTQWGIMGSFELKLLMRP